MRGSPVRPTSDSQRRRSILDEAPESDKRGINPIEVADVLRDDEPRMEIDADVLLRDMDTYERYVRGPRLS